MKIAKKALVSGIQYDKSGHYNGNFQATDMKKFLNILVKDLKSSSLVQQVENNFKEINPYGFDFEEKNVEDTLREYIKSNVPIFLHGLSGDGKSSRVEQIDPDCEIVSLSTLPLELIVGMAIKDQDSKTIKYIAPPWYERLCKKCEEEPNKIHILFLEELPNASHNIQKHGFSIALDRKINDYFALPDNVRIVAAGNEVKESRSSNGLSEPLYNRFGHINIQTTVEDFLTWAMTEEEDYEPLEYKKQEKQPKIHPAIYAYIASRGEGALRSEYTGESPNANPRKWEMASRILYQTKNPTLIKALVGEEITEDFCMFCNQRTISLEEVIAGIYDETTLQNMSSDEKWATVVSLSNVDEEHFEIVRKFLNNTTPELITLFDTLWIKKDSNRIYQLNEVKEAMEERGKNR